jgi:hypothetical protein
MNWFKKNWGYIAPAVITIPTSTPTDMLAYAGTLFSDLYLVVVLAVGIPLAFYVIRRVIALVPKGTSGRRQ